jgi:hypothetical protein
LLFFWLFSLQKGSQDVENLRRDTQQTDSRRTTADGDLDDRTRNDDVNARDLSKGERNVSSRHERPGNFNEAVDKTPDKVSGRCHSARIATVLYRIVVNGALTQTIYRVMRRSLSRDIVCALQ